MMPLRLRVGHALALTVLCVAITAPVRAQMFQVKAEGTLYHVQDPDHLLDASIAVGTPFTYTFTFDRSAPDVDKSPDRSRYNEIGALYGTTITIGDYTFSPGASAVNSLQVEQNPAGSGRWTLTQQTQPMVFTSTNPNAPVVHSILANLYLFYRTPGPITSKAMPPPAAYDVSRLDEGAFIGPLSLLLFGPGNPNQYQDQVFGRITSLTVTPAAAPLDPAAVRREFAAKDAVIATLRRQIAALQARLHTGHKAVH